MVIVEVVVRVGFELHYLLVMLMVVAGVEALVRLVVGAAAVVTMEEV